MAFNPRKLRYKVRSGFEDRISASLKEAGVEFKYESLRLKYIKVCCPNCGVEVKTGTYTPDFLLPNGIIIEAKGLFRSADRTKMIAVKKHNPHLDIRLLFQRDQKIQKKSTTLYSTWAEKQGFKWAVGDTIPQEWIDEKRCV